MASSVNRVTLIGNLGADPEIRSFQNGGRVANMRIATKDTWKNREGERQESTEWHSIAIYSDPLITLVERYLKKGNRVYLEGKLETRKWQDKDGKDRYTTEVTLRPYRGEIQLLDRPPSSDGERSGSNRESPQTDRRPASAPARPNTNNRWAGQGRSAPRQDFLDDDVPF